MCHTKHPTNNYVTFLILYSTYNKHKSNYTFLTGHWHLCLSFELRVRQKSYKSRKNKFIKQCYTLKGVTE